MFNKKGQAALEFLSTYGWAFLVVLVMIGALAYFGVLNPSSYAPDKCVGSTVISCGGSYAVFANTTETNLQIDITNNQQDFVTITSIEMKERSQSGDYNSIIIAGGQQIQSGQTELVNVYFGSAFANNFIDAKKIFLTKVNYKLGTSTINQIAEIEITGIVQAIPTP